MLPKRNVVVKFAIAMFAMIIVCTIAGRCSLPKTFTTAQIQRAFRIFCFPVIGFTLLAAIPPPQFCTLSTAVR